MHFEPTKDFSATTDFLLLATTEGEKKENAYKKLDKRARKRRICETREEKPTWAGEM